MKKDTGANWAFRAFRGAALRVQRRFAGFDPSLDGWPPCDVAEAVDRSWPPIFILGAPRSGTTMLYQAMLLSSELAYVSNLMAAFPSAMPRLVRRWPSLAGPYRGGVREARHGFVPGLLAPSEAGKIMDAWFGAEWGPSAAPRIRATLAAIAQTRKAPILIKSLTLAEHLSSLRSCFPAARFLHMRRDPLYVAQSLLIARRQPRLQPGEWWSVRACAGDTPTFTCDEEIAAYQAVAVDRMVETGLRGASGVVAVRYEAFCEDPTGEMARLRTHLGLTQRSGRQAGFSSGWSRNRPALDNRSWERLSRAVARFSEERGAVRSLAAPAAAS